MKRLLALLLALVMLLSFAACSSEGTTPDSEDEDSAKSETKASDVKIDTSKVTFTEMVVVDNDKCSIKLTELDPDNLFGFAIKAQLENKSTDKTYMFALESASVNGIMCSDMFAAEVAAGKKANKDVTLMDDELEANNIGEYTDIQLTFRVYDSEDYSADDVAKETVHVYPYGEDKATKFEREAKDSDVVLVDNEYATVIVIGYEMDDIWGYTVNLFLVNKTDKAVMFADDDSSVNGFMVTSLFGEAVLPGSCAFSSMSWSESDFEANGITTVEEIEFVLRVYDDEDWSADDFVTEKVTVKP